MKDPCDSFGIAMSLGAVHLFTCSAVHLSSLASRRFVARSACGGLGVVHQMLLHALLGDVAWQVRGADGEDGVATRQVLGGGVGPFQVLASYGLTALQPVAVTSPACLRLRQHQILSTISTKARSAIGSTAAPSTLPLPAIQNYCLPLPTFGICPLAAYRCHLQRHRLTLPPATPLPRLTACRYPADCRPPPASSPACRYIAGGQPWPAYYPRFTLWFGPRTEYSFSTL